MTLFEPLLCSGDIFSHQKTMFYKHTQFSFFSHSFEKSKSSVMYSGVICKQIDTLSWKFVNDLLRVITPKSDMESLLSSPSFEKCAALSAHVVFYIVTIYLTYCYLRMLRKTGCIKSRIRCIFHWNRLKFQSSFIQNSEYIRFLRIFLNLCFVWICELFRKW